MQTTRFTRLAGLVLAVLLTLLVGSVGADDSKLEGTWDVTLQFTGGPPGSGCTPNDTKFLTLNTFLKDGGMLFSSGSNLFAGAGQGSWEPLGHKHFMARFKFFLFNSDGSGSRRGYEELTKDITLTGPDTFTATTTYDFFDAAGNMTAHGCSINESATRFE